MSVMEDEVTGASQDGPADHPHPPTPGHDVGHLQLVGCVHDRVLRFVRCFDLNIR